MSWKKIESNKNPKFFPKSNGRYLVKTKCGRVDISYYIKQFSWFSKEEVKNFRGDHSRKFSIDYRDGYIVKYWDYLSE